MRITEKLMVKDQLISFEVFPPKTDSAFDSIEWSVRELAAFNPDFMSVTYGAGGRSKENNQKKKNRRQYRNERACKEIYC